MRLFIRARDHARSDDASLFSLIDGDILPTVSRRDLRRRAAQIWTSGNRIFGTDNPQLVLQAAISCSGEAPGSGVQPCLWGTIRERDMLERVAGELRSLAALEEQEELGVPEAALDRSGRWKSSSMSCGSGSAAMISG